MSRRAYIPMKVQLAAMLLTVRIEEDGKLVPFIDHETAKQLTADQILSLFHRDHYPLRKVDGGPDAPWNIVFRPIQEHRRKTAKRDQPEIAKSRRLVKTQEEFRRKMLAKAGQGEAGAVSQKKHPMPGSRHHRSKLRKRMNGTVERW
jgi:hypothetical protein